MSSGISMVAGLFVVAAALSGCATPPSDAPKSQPGVARMNMQGADLSYGHIAFGQMIFRPESTEVVVQVSNADGFTLPVHLYTYIHQGSCTSLGPRTTQAPQRVLAYADTIPGLLIVRNTIPVGADTLRGSPHALAVWSSPADGGRLQYCGDLRWS
jgi:hypothetical protein